MEPEEYERTRKKLKDTQYELSSTRTTLEQKIITMEQGARESEIVKKKLMARVDSLESDRRFLYEQEKSTSKKYQALEESSTEFKTTSNEIIRNLREEMMEIKEKYSRLKEETRAVHSDLSIKVRTLASSLAQKDQMLLETQGTSQSQSTLAEEKHRQLADALDKIVELEDKNRQLRLEARNQEDVIRVEKELKNQVAYIKQLETTNRQLTADCKHFKEVYRNIEVLKEEKTGLEQKLKMLDDLRIKCGMLEVQKDVLVKEKQQWMIFLESADVTDFNSPYELAKTLASLRGEKAMLLEMKGESEAALTYRDTVIDQLENQIEKLKKGLVNQEEFCKRQAAIARQHERSKEIALRQAESLREQLKSYDTEETELMGGTYDNPKTLRIEQLEKLVQEYREQLENALSTTRAQLLSDESIESTGTLELLQAIQGNNSSTFSRLISDKQGLFEAKLRLEREMELLRKENASLDAKILEYEMAIGAGAFNPVTSRVLELKDSPASRHQAVRQQMLDALKEENTALLETVTRLQGQNPFDPLQIHYNLDQDLTLQSEGLVPMASYNRLKGDHDRLVQEMAENAKRASRLKESWTSKADEFLDAVRSLLGYKVNFLDNGRVELISVYGSSDDQHSFIFTSGLHDEGTMQFVGSGSRRYMEESKETYDHYVSELGSIPAFLSRVTLDLVDHQSMEDQEQGQESQEHHHHQHPPQPDPVFGQTSYSDFTHGSDMLMDV